MLALLNKLAIHFVIFNLISFLNSFFFISIQLFRFHRLYIFDLLMHICGRSTKNHLNCLPFDFFSLSLFHYSFYLYSHFFVFDFSLAHLFSTSSCVFILQFFLFDSLLMDKILNVVCCTVRYYSPNKDIIKLLLLLCSNDITPKICSN